jgi:hypothetical protein
MKSAKEFLADRFQKAEDDLNQVKGNELILLRQVKAARPPVQPQQLQMKLVV